jgi:hypothetical protein
VMRSLIGRKEILGYGDAPIQRIWRGFGNQSDAGGIFSRDPASH